MSADRSIVRPEHGVQLCRVAKELLDYHVQNELISGSGAFAVLDRNGLQDGEVSLDSTVVAKGTRLRCEASFNHFGEFIAMPLEGVVKPSGELAVMFDGVEIPAQNAEALRGASGKFIEALIKRRGRDHVRENNRR